MGVGHRASTAMVTNARSRHGELSGDAAATTLNVPCQLVSKDRRRLFLRPVPHRIALQSPQFLHISKVNHFLQQKSPQPSKPLM
jgi:hypothetical protein